MTSDFTVKLLGPAGGDRIVARGRVIDARRSSSVAAADLYAVTGTDEVLCATALVSMRNVKLPTET